MKTIYHFLRLVRLLNITVIALTMIVVQLFLTKYLLINTNVYPNNNEILPPDISVIDVLPYLTSKKFLLFLFSTLLIASAGNIINDYFDVRADRINKPNRLIVGVHIKRRWAMLWHWSFNLIGFVFALYLGYLMSNIWIPIVAFISINLLWFYSTYYKRQPFIGNVIVAALLGFIPIYVLIYNIGLSPVFNDTDKFAVLAESKYFLWVTAFTGILAFLANIIRELVKDIIDIRGDLRLGAKTFPIKYGIKKTKYLIAVFYLLILVVGYSFFYYVLDIDVELHLAYASSSVWYVISLINTSVFIGILGIVVLILLVTSFLTIYNHKQKSYQLASNLLKFAMLGGILIPLFL